MKTYKIYTLGCKVNQYDSSKVSRDLTQLGMSEVESGADLAIINTCTVTHSALAKDKKMLEEARKQNSNAKFAIVGCMPVNYREEAEKLGVDYIYGASELDKFVKEVKRTVNSEQRSILVTDYCSLITNYKSDKSRYFLKIQDGCQQFCTYCIIPYNRGKLTSRDSQGIIEEVKRVTEHGTAEVVLCGIHLGLYGMEGKREKGKGESLNLVGLMQELFKIETLKKIRLSSIEITEVTDEMIELMKTNRKFARHLHISLQSGCDKILKAMNRPYTTEYFRERVAKLRQVIPEVAISTDVIVGFPGEADEDFQATLQYCQALGFSKIHVFPFSAHEKTPAFGFPDQVSEDIKKQRAKELQVVSNELEKKYSESFIGQEIDVIVDGRSKFRSEDDAAVPREGTAFLNGAVPRESAALLRGKSEYYFDVKFQSENELKVGQLVRVKNWELI